MADAGYTGLQLGALRPLLWCASEYVGNKHILAPQQPACMHPTSVVYLCMVHMGHPNQAMHEGMMKAASWWPGHEQYLYMLACSQSIRLGPTTWSWCSEYRNSLNFFMMSSVPCVCSYIGMQTVSGMALKHILCILWCHMHT